jgi:hypothetical protein
MSKINAVPAAEFIRNFGRYKMLAQKTTVPVTSHGVIAGYFVPVDEYEAFEDFRKQRRSFLTRNLPQALVEEIAQVEMDSRHEELNRLLDE